MKKRDSGSNNRFLYFLIVFGVLLTVAVGVYASSPTGTVPNPGHKLSEIQRCSDGSAGVQILETNSSGVWNCVSASSVTPWASAANGIYYNSGNVGIGAAPDQYDGLLVNKSGANFGIYTGALSSKLGGGTGASIGTSTSNGKLVFFTQSGDAVAIDSSGRVGINTPPAANTLKVGGDIYSTGDIESASSLKGATVYSGGSAVLTSESDPVWTAASSNYYTKTQSDAKYFSNIKNFTGTLSDGNYCTYSQSSGRINCASNPSSSFVTYWSPTSSGDGIYTTSGKVGIGTSSPAAFLDVNGNASFENHRVTNVATPVASSDAATKSYVDAAVGGVVSRSQTFTSSGTFTVPTGVTMVWVTAVGGGGGGGGYASGFGFYPGGSGTASSFGSSVLASGGTGGVVKSNAGFGGPAGGGGISLNGVDGQDPDSTAGGKGGASPFGPGPSAGSNGVYYGTGGGGGTSSGGGGAGAYIKDLPVTVTPGQSVSVTIGSGGSGAYVNGQLGGNGKSGIVIVSWIGPAS